MNTDRRQFLKSTAITIAGICAPTIIPGSALGKNGSIAPSERINFGCIGVGGMGTGHVRSFSGYDDVQIRAICDVRKEHADRAKDIVDRRYNNKDCQTYNDFRELLARKDIDAVLIAVPDHWHVLIGLEAVKQGKDMYYEKPLSLSITEAKAIRNAVQGSDVIFQFGTQQRSGRNFRRTIELIRNGYIGDLETIMIGSAGYEQIPYQSPQPIPEGFDYDMWLGPAPQKPYTFERCTRNWTLIKDYSLGCLSGAWGIHQVDIAQFCLGTDHTVPTITEATGIFPNDGFYDTTQSWEAIHTYENGFKLHHMDMHTAKTKAVQFDLHWMGVLFKGSEGWIYTTRETMHTFPESLQRETIKGSGFHLPPSNSQRRNFLDAVKSRKETISPIEAAYHADIICHHADISMRLGRKLEWDIEKEEFKNDPEANRMQSRPMRSPWHL